MGGEAALSTPCLIAKYERGDRSVTVMGCLQRARDGKADWLAVVMPDEAAFRRGGTNGAMQVEGRDMKG